MEEFEAMGVRVENMSELVGENRVEGLSLEWLKLDGGCLPTTIRSLILRVLSGSLSEEEDDYVLYGSSQG